MTAHAPIMDELKRGLSTHSDAATQAIAIKLAPHLPADTVLALHGDLGAGKTTFVKGLARAWAIKEAVTSPSYNLYTIYSGDRQLIHFDAYRLNSEADLDALMIEDFLRSPWCFAVEWPKRIAASLPEDTWHLYLSIKRDKAHHLRLEIQHSSSENTDS
ncbi:MAG: tRNA (adenosine(37)-N6)-threonylcarbamoyltransferase complex ATPase subunit type 1 TsaE [Verrucomicrobia bacterium]|jgi:tRNA threonylcarbamoyladenosine biosynthesis protein TsaE|nr:tRNA (adenosine(37)-N6)-threonylcarbamoyltransferase complex ATPase subunit type 1 TsaE [Verrucomicrobiota bacterium]